MRILLVNNLFQPEPNHLKGLAFARALQARGHDVHVLTGFPNYPGGTVYPGYKVRWTLEEELEGVPVTRVAMYASHDRSGVRRALAYGSLGLSQLVHGLAWRRRFDVCHAYLGPITLLWPAFALRALHGTKVVADVQDLWPESVTDSGMLRSGPARRVLESASRGSYRRADRLVVLSPGYREALAARGVPADRIEVVYNWCDEAALGAPANAGADVLEPGPFHVVYAGNLGKLQGMDVLLDAARLLAREVPALRLTLLGDGVEGERLRRRVRDEGLSNVRMTGRLPLHLATGVQRRADVLVAHLEDRPLARIGIPQKVQAYLASGRPLVLAAEGDAAELVRRSKAGRTCPPGDAAALARALAGLAAAPAAERERMGASGARFYREELGFERGVARMEEVFQSALSPGREAA